MIGPDDDRYWVGPAVRPDTYQLVSPLGGGGEGEVWKGLVPLSTSGRGLVAVKIMSPSDSYDQNAWTRYSHLIKSLDHPGLVRVVDVFLGPAKHRAGTVEATDVDTTELPVLPGLHHYVVMKLIEGVTLQEWLEERLDTPISQRLRVLMMVASALDEMHSGRQTGVPVAHGDVKPSNIIIREDGSSVLVDLGLTRITDGYGRHGRSRPYAAPELFALGALTTPEADRFAFIAALVHSVTGETPPTSAGRGLDIEAVAKLLRNHPLTFRRPLLINGVLAALQSAPDGRPAPLALWLASLTDTLSQTTQPGGDGVRQVQTVSLGRLRWRRVVQTIAAIVAMAVLGAGSLFIYNLIRGNLMSPSHIANGQSDHSASPTTPSGLIPTQSSPAESAPADSASSSGRNSPTPSSGGLLPYQADWSLGMGGWVTIGGWRTVGGMLVNDGSSGSTAMSAIAPLDLSSTPDYVVQADIQLVDYVNSVASFGIVVRATDSGGGYGAGSCTGTVLFACADTDYAAMIWPVDGNQAIKTAQFDPKNAWHTYRVEVNGNQISMWIDGALRVTATDNRFLSGSRVGLWSGSTQISVRKFSIESIIS